MIGYNEKKAVQTEEPDIKLHKLFRIYRPKYEKSPKKSEKRKSIRALSCFALVFAALMASVGTSYAKYISEPVTIPPFSVNAAQFAFEAKQMTPEEAEKYKSEHLTGLNDNQLLVCAFTVSNEERGNISEVDINCDLIFRANMLIDLSNPKWFNYSIGELPSLFSNGVKAVLYVDGVKKEELKSTISNNPASDPPADLPMPAADPSYLTLPVSWVLQNSDSISLEAGNKSTHTCAIVLDITEYSFTETLPLSNTSEPSITITANQKN